MAGVSESELVLLGTIVRLTSVHSGRPPTLAEIAQAIGLQVSSRGNIQRQLTHLRAGGYVDWSRSSRSLQVTPLGISLLEVVPASGPIPAPRSGGTVLPGAGTVPLSSEVLSLIASGLTKLTSDVAEGRPVQAPYPEAWRRGLNRLAAECVLRDIEFPTTTPEAIAWCKLPPSEWPVRFDMGSASISTPLLEDDQPTALCRELAYTRDAELQASEAAMKRVLQEARLHGATTAYTKVRRFIIENPVVGGDQLVEAALDPDMAGLGSYITDMYERVPVSVEIGREVLLCGHCGWTLEIRDGRLQCGDKRCSLLTDGFTKKTGRRAYMTDLWRVRRAIRRYIVAPGTYEILAAKRLEKLGLTVSVWPCFDAYDLRIIFPDGQAWAVDVKDWQFPTQLARRLDRISMPPGCEWSRGFYVVPDDRVRENREYLTILQNAMAYPDISVLSVSGLLELAREKIGAANGNA
jgi:hypothetical protein